MRYEGTNSKGPRGAVRNARHPVTVETWVQIPSRTLNNTRISTEGRDQAEHACPALTSQRLDQVVQLVDTRRSERRAPRGLGSSNLPLVTAGRAGARRAFIRLATRIVTGVCNCWVSLFVSHVEASRRMSVNCHLKHADQPRRTDFWFRVSMSYAPEREENRTLARTG